jgi:type IV pilus biogenesis protein CpaD/CtpE
MSSKRNLLMPLALLAALSGCSSTPRFNSHFGEAVRANLTAQVLDPAAATNANPAIGIDGVAARATQERYQRSFSETSGVKQPLVAGGVGDR